MLVALANLPHSITQTHLDWTGGDLALAVCLQHDAQKAALPSLPRSVAEAQEGREGVLVALLIFGKFTGLPLVLFLVR